MRRLLLIAVACIVAVTATAQQLKTAQGITIENTTPTPERESKQPKQVLETKCGFQQSVEFHISPDLTGSRFFYGFEYIAGYRINNTFFAGGGTGVEGYIDSIAMPIYCTARAYLLPKSRWQPLISLSFGTVVALSSSGWRCHTPIALHINPNVGINYRINQKYSCYCGIGYMMRETKKNYGRDISTNCLTIRAGFTF